MFPCSLPFENKSSEKLFSPCILLALEIQRFKSVKACRPKARQAKVNANSSTNSLKMFPIVYLWEIK
ncbi:MAG: hypothetical protein LBP59_11790 [Planctomycetaceae bacterium]|nr:hypothetical protein [Planctomycetaceae bacterium]